MKIAFVGYMCSGKSHWASKLAKALELQFVDLDRYLETNILNTSITNFIAQNGELAFRKAERSALLAVLEIENCIIATGGGTPCYYDNMALLNLSSVTVFLDVPLQTLVERLMVERKTRPLVAHLQDEDVKEFVAKHLFERKYFYYQAKYILAENTEITQLINIFKTNNA